MENIVFYIDSLIGFVTGQAIFVLIDVAVFFVRKIFVNKWFFCYNTE